MRVTQGMMYNSMTTNMNSILGQYMESNLQAGTQKQINRPSDDPAGVVQVLNYRAAINDTSQYNKNSQDAYSTLTSADAALLQAQTIIVRITELAEQAATGTYTAEQRMTIGFEIEQMYEQLLVVANTEFNGNHLFSGQQTSGIAYSNGLGVTTLSPELENVDMTVDGNLDQTAIVRFPTDGTIGGTEDLTYEYSLDGGKNWVSGTLKAGDTSIDVGASVLNFKTSPTEVKGYTPHTDNSEGLVLDPLDGTKIMIRPTAIYQGDDNNASPEVDIYGSDITSAHATGTFTSNTQIRFDSQADLNSDGEVSFSYSNDNGLTWISAKATTSKDSGSLRLIVPGGYVDVEADADGIIDAGQQLVVRPNRASNLGYEIANGEFMDVTIAGIDIFGGSYQSKYDEYNKPVEGTNIFETISDLIAWAQTNNQDGCGQALEELKEASTHLLAETAKVGAKENRLSLNIAILEMHSDDQKGRMSGIEDIDITQLMRDLTKQQTAYQAVLQSSAMIKGMSLMNYL